MTDLASPAADALFASEPAAVRCPFAAYQELHRDGVRFVPRVGAYVVSRHADIQAVFRDPDVFSSRNTSGPNSATSLAGAIVDGQRYVDEFPGRDRLLRFAARRAEIGKARALISADPPLHGLQRALVRPAFAPRRIAALEPRITAIAEELVAAFPATGEVDLVRAFCRPLPMRVIAEALGVPHEHKDDFARWSDAFITGLGRADLDAAEALAMFGAIDEFYDYFTAELDRRATDPREDLVTDVATATLKDGTALDRPQQLQLLSLLLVGGNETTSSLLSSSMLTLAEDPGLRARLLGDGEALTGFVEEMLRAESPTTGIYRVVTRDTELGGTPIPEGSFVFLALHAGNHDPDRTGGERGHLAFGHGAHLCLGAPLARAEARIGITVLLCALERVELIHERTDHVYFRSFANRALTTLPVRIERTTP